MTSSRLFLFLFPFPFFSPACNSLEDNLCFLQPCVSIQKILCSLDINLHAAQTHRTLNAFIFSCSLVFINSLACLFPLPVSGCHIPLSTATQGQLHCKLIMSEERGSAVFSSCQHRCQGELGYSLNNQLHNPAAPSVS